MKSESRKAGRPKGADKDFLADPDRYTIAFSDALRRTGMAGEKALKLAIVAFEAERTADVSKVPRGALKRPDWALVGYKLRDNKAGRGAESRLSTLRGKAARAIRPQDVHFRSAMAAAFYVIFFQADLSADVRAATARSAGIVAGESLFVERVLIPVLTNKDAPTEFNSTSSK